MRKSILAILGTVSMLLLAGFGCDSSYVKKLMPPSPPMEPKITSPDARAGSAAPLAVFGQELTMSLNTKVSYSDGLSMEVVGVTDTRCPQDTKCDTQGVATVKVQLTGGSVGDIPKEVTVIKPGQVIARLNGYILFLGEVAGNTATLTLSKEQPPKPKPAKLPPPPPAPTK